MNLGLPPLLKLDFDDDGKVPLVRCVVNFTKFLENRFSINVEVETKTGKVKVMYLPPFQRLEDLDLKKDCKVF